MTATTGFGKQVGMGHTPTGPTGAMPGSGRPGPSGGDRSGLGRTAVGLVMGGVWGGIGGVLGAIAVGGGLGILTLVEEGDPAAAAGLAFLVSLFGAVVGGIVGGILGGLAGLALSAAKGEQSAPIVAGVVSVLVYGTFFSGELDPGGATGAAALLPLGVAAFGVAVFGAIGYLVGRGFERSTRPGTERDPGHGVPTITAPPLPDPVGERPPWTWGGSTNRSGPI